VGGCDFDDGLSACGYNTQPSGDFLWKIASGSTPSFGTGPSQDHTDGFGTVLLYFARWQEFVVV